MLAFTRKPRPSRRLTDERLAAMALYSTRCRDALTQRLDLQTKAPESRLGGGLGRVTQRNATSK